jgi:vacuolar-type H+-ATPase subunit H
MVTKNGKVKEIWGRQFSIVRNGLDEVEVFSFISRVIEQNRDLSDKLEHVDSLRRLAEKAVIEASRHSERIKTEAENIANEKALDIIGQAQQQGRAEVERIITEAEKHALDRISASEQLAQDMLAQAEEKAKELTDQILAEAQERARTLGDEILARSEETARIQAEKIVPEAEQKAESTAQEKFAAAEQQSKSIIESAEAEAESIITSAAAEANTTLANAMDMMEAAERQAGEMMTKAEEQAESIKNLAEEEAAKLIAEIKHKAEFSAQARIDKAEEEGQRIIRESKKIAELEGERVKRGADDIRNMGDRIQDDDLKEKFERLCDLLLANGVENGERPAVLVHREEVVDEEDPSLFQGAVELDFPPPLDSGRVLKIHKQLSKTPKLKVVDVEGSSRGGIRIRVHLGARLPLLEMLESLPEVERVSNGVKPMGKSQRHPGKGQNSTIRRIVVSTKT